MTTPPLTHHDILTLVEPFARRGRHVDMSATNRIERRIVFRAVDHEDGAMVLHDTLQLDCLDTGTWRLTRTLTRPGGLQADATTLGQKPEALLERIAAVAPASQFSAGPGWVVARHIGFDGGGPVLTGGAAVVDGLTLTLRVPAVRGVAAELALAPTAAPLALPEDLLAVLGWNWARLVPDRNGWTSRLRLRGDAARRSARAQAALDEAAAHLARVLAEPPERFHARLLLPRWGVVLRRAIPTLTAIGLVAGVVFLPRVETGSAPGLWTLLHDVPIALLALAFCLQELPRFEIPPLPRRPRQANWRLPVRAGNEPTGRAA